MLTEQSSLSRGILLILLAIASFSAGDASVKWIGGTVNEVQIVWARYLALFFFIALLLTAQGKIRAAIRLNRPTLTIGRSALLPAFDFLFITAFILLPLATVNSISSSVPIMVTILSVFVLRETIRIYRWIAVIIGCVGVLIIVNPLSVSFDRNLVFPLSGAVILAFYQILIKIGANRESQGTNQLYMGLVPCILTSLCVPFFWQELSMQTLLLLMGISLFHAVGHFLMILAMTLTSPSNLQPFFYTGLLWATFYGWFFFSELPDLKVVTGLCLIVASGLFVLYRQRVLQKRGEAS
ncbi:DMT family transporter [Kiloniella sp. b19]|uniref:DMT family transporter n=1 Tax=Kiloniella sp. GXU_MW_B19 TaxID=3141326 RepID=UPI0031D4534F